MKKIAIAVLSMIYVLIFFMVSDYAHALPEWVGMVLSSIFLGLCIYLVYIDKILIDNYAEVTIDRSKKQSIYGIKRY